MSSSVSGWAPSTSQSGYHDPFPIHHLEQNGETVALADSDIATWRDVVGTLVVVLRVAVVAVAVVAAWSPCDTPVGAAPRGRTGVVRSLGPP